MIIISLIHVTFMPFRNSIEVHFQFIIITFRVIVFLLCPPVMVIVFQLHCPCLEIWLKQLIFQMHSKSIPCWPTRDYCIVYLAQKKCFTGFNIYTIYEHTLAYHRNRKNKDNIRIAKGLLQLNIQMQQYITMPDIVNKAEMFINLLHSCWAISIHLVGFT